MFPGCEEGTARVATHSKTNGVACMIGVAALTGGVNR